MPGQSYKTDQQSSNFDPWDLLDYASNNIIGGLLGGAAEVSGGIGGGLAGMLLGPLGVVGGARTIARELDKDAPSNASHLIDGTLGMVAGTAGTIGGAGVLAGSSTLASMGPVGAVIGAGAAGFAAGTMLGEGIIDPYLNRAHFQDVDEAESKAEFEARENGETTITQDLNNWLDTW